MSTIDDLRYLLRIPYHAQTTEGQASLQRAIAEIEQLQENSRQKDELISLYIAGECACPKRYNSNPKAVHFPGCPMLAKEEIERLKTIIYDMHARADQGAN